MSTPPPAASSHRRSDHCGGTPGRRVRSSAARDTASRSRCSSARIVDSPSPPLCASGSLYERQLAHETKTITSVKVYDLNRRSLIKGCTYLFRYLQIMPATFSQFFLVGQNIKQDWCGITSVTRAMMWSGSSFCIPLEYCYKQTNKQTAHT